MWVGRGWFRLLACDLPVFLLPLFPQFDFVFSGMGTGPLRGGWGWDPSRK